MQVDLCTRGSIIYVLMHGYHGLMPYKKVIKLLSVSKAALSSHYSDKSMMLTCCLLPNWQKSDNTYDFLLNHQCLHLTFLEYAIRLTQLAKKHF